MNQLAMSFPGSPLWPGAYLWGCSNQLRDGQHEQQCSPHCRNERQGRHLQGSYNDFSPCCKYTWVSFSTCFVCPSLCYHIVCHHAQQAGQKAILIGSVQYWLGIMFVVCRLCYLQPLKGLLLYSPRKMERGKPHSNWRLTKATLGNWMG